jgi:hypothetical protein
MHTAIQFASVVRRIILGSTGEAILEVGDMWAACYHGARGVWRGLQIGQSDVFRRHAANRHSALICHEPKPEPRVIEQSHIRLNPLAYR